jgi:hypothetical protein
MILRGIPKLPDGVYKIYRLYTITFCQSALKILFDETMTMNQTYYNQGTKIGNYALSLDAVREKRPWVVMT